MASADEEVVDKEKLVHLVETYEFLYNKDDKKYKNKIKVTAAWREIAKNMGISDVELVKKTWRNVVDTRNSYKRADRKKNKSGSGSTTSASLDKWSLAGATSFLDRYNEPPKTVSNVPSTTNDSGSAAEQSGDDASSYVKYRPQKKRKTATDPLEAELLKLMKDDDRKDEDEDKGFFMSLYNDFKRLTVPSATKMKIKMELMQVLYNAAEQSASGPSAVATAQGAPAEVQYMTISAEQLQALMYATPEAVNATPDGGV